jgi:hypothetical protein
MLATAFGDAYREYRRRCGFDPTLALQSTPRSSGFKAVALG